MKLNHYICSMAAAGAVFLPVVSDALNTSWLVYNSPAPLNETDYFNKPREVALALVERFAQARHSVLIESGYVVAGEQGLSELSALQESGTRVQVLTN